MTTTDLPRSGLAFGHKKWTALTLSLHLIAIGSMKAIVFTGVFIMTPIFELE